jgi:diguanylate cyclase (GGDEF)-like protein
MTSGAGITGWVTANRQAMYNSDPRLDFDALRLELDEPYHTSVVVPLIKDGDMLGGLALYSKDLKAYGADHLRLVEAVAKLASDAIANALHHELVEARALTDALTGLANARALRHQFEEDANRARRHSETFSLLMMDLDGFKRINDTLGHQAGDDVLREVAQILSSQIRASDFLSRYAGDEFVAIVQAGPSEVHELVGRLQHAIQSFNYGFATPGPALGISVGWACFGADGATLDELLLAADRSMYANKSKRKAVISDSAAKAEPDVESYTIM